MESNNDRNPRRQPISDVEKLFLGSMIDEEKRFNNDRRSIVKTKYHYRAAWMWMGMGGGHRVETFDYELPRSEWYKYLIYAGPFTTYELAGKKKALDK